MKNEVLYYSEIKKFIEIQLKSNFIASCKRNLYVFWGIGELKSNLQRIINENPKVCLCAEHFSKLVPPLNLDIFALITDGNRYELLILEVKKLKTVGLSEWSQLIGYCLVSGAKYGLLLNIDNGASPRLIELLQTEYHLSYIQTIKNNERYIHNLGLMQWNSLTQNFEYSNLGIIKSISDLSFKIIKEFESK